MTDISRPHRTRVGTIVWGAILIVAAAFAFLVSAVGLGPLSPAILLWSIIGFGGLLVIAAVVAAIVRAARPHHDGDQPIG
jgi:hypothetical protein